MMGGKREGAEEVNVQQSCRVCAGAAALSSPERSCGNQMWRSGHGGGSEGLVSAHNYS